MAEDRMTVNVKIEKLEELEALIKRFETAARTMEFVISDFEIINGDGSPVQRPIGIIKLSDAMKRAPKSWQREFTDICKENEKYRRLLAEWLALTHTLAISEYSVELRKRTEREIGFSGRGEA